MNNLLISKKNILIGMDYKVVYGIVDDFLLSKLIYDNRLVENDIAFICIKGARFDTHDDIFDIIKNGSKLVVIDQNIDVDSLIYKLKNNNININNLTIVKVNDTRIALAVMSKNYFKNPTKDLKLIGITGTKGKTTTAFMIKKILEVAGHKTGIIGTIGCEFNNKKFKTNNTTPESYILYDFFYQMKNDGVEYVVMEVSSQSLKLNRVYGLYFDYAIWTNISPDHIGVNEHKDFDDYFNCKLRIFNNCKNAIINADDKHFETVLKYCQSIGLSPITYSIKDVKKHIFSNDKYFGIEFNCGMIKENIIISMPGLHNVQNAICAISVAKAIGINDYVIKNALSDVSVNGRVEIIEKNDDFTVLVDYAHNEVGTEALINSIKEYDHKRIVVVFGSGGNRDVERRYGMGHAVGRLADFCIVTADNSRFEKTIDIINQIVEALRQETDQYIIIEDRSEAIKYAINNHKKGDIICIIGKGHEDYNDFQGKKTYFSDREEVLKAINGK